MSIPSNVYPTSYDTSTNLYNVVDALTIPLAKDYNPGDKVVYVSVAPYIMARFPASGIITLTENCSVPSQRAVSIYYNTKSNEGFFFTDLTVLPETPDSYKPATVTSVSLNVTAQHHNAIKNAIISIEDFVGLKSDTSFVPFEGTISARTKYLFETVFTPRAWFVADNRIGRAPFFNVLFTSTSLYLGEQVNGNNITYKWNFGDGTEITTSEKTITHTYVLPNIYTVSLEVTNMFGSDTVVFENFIDALWLAPDPAVIAYDVRAGQQDFDSDGNNFLKTPTSVYVYVATSNAVDPLNPDRTLSGAHIVGGNIIDPIVNFTWDMGDTLTHGDSPETKALYTIGGIYSVVLRCDTRSTAYRITTDPKTINVIERQNAWLFVAPSDTALQTVYAGEMGFLNETFKPLQNTSYTYQRNAEFITGSAHLEKERMLLEFVRNTNLNAKSTVGSGLGGLSILSWAGGRTAAELSSTERVYFIAYSGFEETYSSPGSTGWTMYRPWNWIAFNGTAITYYLLGNAVTQEPFSSPTNNQLVSVNLLSGEVKVEKTFSGGDFQGAANYLTYNEAQYDQTGYNIYGAYSAYRTAFRGRTGYILKNRTVGSEFFINSFYCTTEDANGLISGFKKKPDMGGPLKTQGVLVNLTTGLFFFNNSGSVLQFDVTTDIWKTGGPGYNSITFSNLQDKSVEGYDNENNSLVATTDFADTAFLSFDYSNSAYIKFNDVDLSFTKLNSRPEGGQWIFGSY